MFVVTRRVKMQAFADQTLAFPLLEALDMPSLYYTFSAEKPILPLELEIGLRKVLKEAYAINNLYQRFDLPLGELNFPSFFALWCRKRLFSQNTPLFFLFEQCKIYTSIRVLYKASKYRRFDFVDEFLTRKRLWYSYDHVKAICRGIFSSPFTDDQQKDYSGAWHVEKVKIYQKKFLNILEGLEQEAASRFLDEACFDAGHAIGLDNAIGGYLEDFLYAERWDVVRKMLNKDEPPLSISKIGINKPKLYLYPERIPEDLRAYFLFDRMEDQKLNFQIGSKAYLQLSRKVDCQACGIRYQRDEYCYDLEDAKKVAYLKEVPAWFQAKSFALGLSDQKPILDNSHHEQSLLPKQQVWLSKNGHLKEGAAFRDQLAFAIQRALDKDKRHYDPELLRCLCKHHWTELKTMTNQEELLKLVKGDQLMEQFILSLLF